MKARCRKAQPKLKRNDWVCSLCSNYNYSFRTHCNRCHIQPRDSPLPHIQDNPSQFEDSMAQSHFPCWVLVSWAEEGESEGWRDNIQESKWIRQLID